MNLYAWGYNNKGQLGDNTVVDKLVPTKIGTKTWKQVCAGTYHQVALEIKSIEWIKHLTIINQSFVGRSNRDII